MSSGPPLKKLKQTMLQFYTRPKTNSVSDLQDAVKRRGFVVDDVPAMGNCMFEALSRQLTRFGKVVTHDEVRAAAVNFIQQNPMLSGIQLDTALMVEYGGLDQYLKKMSRTGFYGDGTILNVVQLIYNHPVRVYYCDKVISLSDNVSEDAEALLLGYVNDNHYVSIVPQENVRNAAALLSEHCGSKSKAVTVDEHATVTSPSQLLFTVPTQSQGNGKSESISLALATITAPSDIATCAADGPNQPILSRYPSTICGTQERRFLPSYYSDFPFIEYSISRDAVFCFPCRMFPCAGSFASKSESSFTVVGVPRVSDNGTKNWRKIYEKLRAHGSTCSSHLLSAAKWNDWKLSESNGDVISQLHNYSDEEVMRNRKAIATLSRVTLLCARQDLALRGHCENPVGTNVDAADANVSCNRGNILEILNLLKLESCDSKEVLEKLPKNATYTSKDSQNSLLKSAAHLLRTQIALEISQQKMIAVIADESRDISKVEQLSVCVRYVFNENVKERFIDFVALSNLDSKSLSTAIAECLTKHKIPLQYCVAQCYDGASVMSGRMNGVQARFRELCKTPCVYVHCYAHRLNLVLVDTCAQVRCAGDLLGLLELIYVFISASSLRHGKFASIQQSDNVKILEMPMQSDTRWVCKLKGVSTFKSRLKQLMHLLKLYSSEGKPVERTECNGLLLQINFTTVFMLHLLHEILVLVNGLSMYMQGRQASLFRACKLVTATVASIRALRSDESFEKIIVSATEQCKCCDISVPNSIAALFGQSNVENAGFSGRPCRSSMKLPMQLSDCLVMSTLGQRRSLVYTSESGNFSNDKDELRVQMFEVLDRVNAEMTRRFCDNEPFLIACETVDPTSEIFMNHEYMKPVADWYVDFGIDSNKLRAQTTVVKEMFKGNRNANVHEVLKSLLSMKCGEKSVFPDLLAFVNLIMTLPVSSAQAERTFSTMKRVKNYLRSTMGDERLSDLCLISVERDLSYDMMQNPENIVDDFAKKGNRRIQLQIKKD